MASGKHKRLETTIAAIQQRWGQKAIRRLGPADKVREVPCVPTGFPDLNKILGIGGIPRGRITELLGAPTSGMSTLALNTIATAQSRGEIVVYVDLSHTFDPDYAARCKVNLANLYVVRPHTGREALEITQSLASSGGTGVLIFDSVTHLLREPHPAREISDRLRQLNVALSDSPCALIFLTPLYFGDDSSAENYPEGFALPHYATIRLLIEKARWIQKRHDIRGYQARVLVLKNKLGEAGKNTTIAITFNGVVHGDGT